MSLETAFIIKDTKQSGDVYILSQANTPAQTTIKFFKDLRACGYPMRNTITRVLRELLYLKLEIDFKGDKHKTQLRSADARGSTARLGPGKETDLNSIVRNARTTEGLPEAQQ